jgi:hypothetical protein
LGGSCGRLQLSVGAPEETYAPLQILPQELREFRQPAKQQGVTVSEWVRQALQTGGAARWKIVHAS